MTGSPGRGKIFSSGALPPAQPSRFVRGADDLSDAERDLADQYSVRSGSRGVLAGAVIGPQPWDIRPIRVEGGIVTLVRVSEPSEDYTADRLKLIEQYTRRIADLSELPGLRAFGKSDGIWWSKRRFYPQVLSEVQPQIIVDPGHFFLQVIQLVEQLHRAQIVHGHISPANIAVLDGAPILLDTGWWVFRGEAMTRATPILAPELQAGFAVSPAADLYGLGTIAEKLGLLADQGAPPQVARLLSREPSLRPSLPQLKKVVEDALGVEAHDAFDEEETLRRTARTRPNVDRTVRRPPPSKKTKRRTEEVEPEPEVEVAEEPQPTPTLNRFVLIFLLVLLVGLVTSSIWGSFLSPPPYRDWWVGDRVDLQRRVAIAAAVEGDPDAQAAIIESVRSAAQQPADVNGSLIRMAFMPQWEDKLTPEDRKLALSVALIRLLPQDAIAIQTLDQANPAVILALAGNLPLTEDLPEPRRIPLSKFAALGPPFSTAFGALKDESGTPQTLSFRPARALCRMFLGDFSSSVVAALFSLARLDFVPPEVSRGRLLALFLAVQLYPDSGEMAYESLERLPTSETFGTQWFEQFPEAEWTRVPAGIRIGILAGVLSRELRNEKSLFDLVSYPDPKIRAAAATIVWTELAGEHERAAVEYLASQNHAFTRAQNFLFLAALRLPPAKQSEFFAQWFRTDPDPKSVVGLLRVRIAQGPNDVWNILAARYLRRVDWPADLALLNELTEHPEPLVRALGYSRLRISDPQERDLIRQRSQTEPDRALRESLIERIGDGADSAKEADDLWQSVEGAKSPVVPTAEPQPTKPGKPVAAKKGKK